MMFIGGCRHPRNDGVAIAKLLPVAEYLGFTDESHVVSFRYIFEFVFERPVRLDVFGFKTS